MIDGADRTLGRVVALVALESVTKGSDGTRAALRVAGFDKPIVKSALVETARQLNSGTAAEVLVKVGTSEAIDGIPPEFLLQPGEQLTAWRNVTGSGESVLLFDWGVPPDAQGLTAVNRLDGSSLVSGVEQDKRFATFAREAWFEAGGQGTTPRTLESHQLRVWRAVSESEEEGRSLRRLARYLVESATSVVNAEVHTAEVTQSAVSDALPTLGLFPDGDLFVSDSALEARIRKNVRVSGLRQPSGAILTEEDLLARIDAAELTDVSLARVGLSSDEAKTHMRNLVMESGERTECARRALDLSLWLEVFEKRSAKIGLGRQIREAIERSAAARLDEFDALLVEDGLDRSDQEAAERFLFAEPPADTEPLADVLPKPLRRRVEKIAFPDSLVVPDPLRALLRELTYFDDEEEGTVTVRVEGAPEAGAWTRWLFAFLYGRSLKQVQASVGLRLGLEVDADLLDCKLRTLPRTMSRLMRRKYGLRSGSSWRCKEVPRGASVGIPSRRPGRSPSLRFSADSRSLLERCTAVASMDSSTSSLTRETGSDPASNAPPVSSVANCSTSAEGTSPSLPMASTLTSSRRISTNGIRRSAAHGRS